MLRKENCLRVLLCGTSTTTTLSEAGHCQSASRGPNPSLRTHRVGEHTLCLRRTHTVSEHIEAELASRGSSTPPWGASGVRDLYLFDKPLKAFHAMTISLQTKSPFHQSSQFYCHLWNKLTERSFASLYYYS